MKTSILDTFCGALCDAVTGTGGGSRLLKIINERNGFLISLDGDKEWYRYHHLFKELLDKMLVESDINRTELCFKAAVWYENSGYPNKAMW